MRLFILGLALLASVCGARAQGCGPTRLKVSESVTLDIAPAKAWRLVGGFQDMSWARNTRATIGSGGNEPDVASRKVTFDGGVLTRDSLYKYNDAGMTYAYHVDSVDEAALPIQNASVTIEVVSLDGGAKSKVIWRAAFYRFIKPGEIAPDQADAAAVQSMGALARGALEGLKTRSEART